MLIAVTALVAATLRVSVPDDVACVVTITLDSNDNQVIDYDCREQS